MGGYLKFLFPVIVLSSAAAAQAQGFYLRGDAGIAMMDSFVGTNQLGSPPAPPGTTAISEANIEMGNSFQWQAGVGYEFNDYWRIDLTGGQSTRFDLEGVCIPSDFCPPIQVLKSDISSTQVFLNGYLELATFLFGEQRWFHPYIGVGLGYAHNEISQVYTMTRDGQPISNVDPNSAGDFAWRVIGGLAFEISEQLFIDLSYSYMDLGDLQAGNTVTVVVPNSVFTFELPDPFTTEMVVQEVLLGLRYQF